VAVRVAKDEFDSQVNEIRIMLQGTEQKVEVFVNETPENQGIKVTQEMVDRWDSILEKSNTV
jgi:hypothetical protein